MHTSCYWSNEFSPVHKLITCRPDNRQNHTPSHITSTAESTFLSFVLFCLNQRQSVFPSIHPVAWGCSPFPSVPSMPGPSPSWLEYVSFAWLPWFVEIPPWPHCRTPWLSAWAPVCASPLSPTCEAAACEKIMSITDDGTDFIWFLNRGLCPHRSSSCLRALLCALRALSSACLFCSSARTSSSESPPGPGLSSESNNPCATSSSLIRASRERVWGTLEKEAEAKSMVPTTDSTALTASWGHPKGLFFESHSQVIIYQHFRQKPLICIVFHKLTKLTTWWSVQCVHQEN